MIFLTATTETLTLVTAAALSLDWSTGYVDIDSTTGATPGSDQGNVATATTTTVVAAPAASVQRQLKSLTAVNKDAALTQTVTLNKVTAGGTFALARNVALAPNETLIWVDTIGFVVLDSFGVHKVANTLVNLSTGVTGTLPAEFGGTGIASYTVGDILYASGATALSALPDVATGNALISGGVGAAPAWGKIALTTHVSGILPVANGGTGLASGTSGGILGYTASGVLASSGLLTASALLLGGGAGATPSAMASLGTTTTVLHGNVAGPPSFSAVALTTDVSGTLPVANGGTGITSLGTGVATWLGTPSSANLLAAMTDETGTGALVFANTPTLVTPAIGAATGTSVNLTSTATASAFIPTGSSIPANGLYLPAANTLALSTASAERVRVDSSGNVGFGGTSSGARLETFKTSAAVTPASDDIFPAMTSGAILKNLSATNGCYAALSLVAANATGTSQGFSLVSQSTASGFSPDLLIMARTSAGTTTERMRIDASGNVGIGTSPSHRFHVLNTTAGGNVAVFANTGATTTFLALAATNGTDSDLQIRVSGVGAGTKFTSIGPSEAVPLLLNTGGTERVRIDSSGNPIFTMTATPPTLATNSNVTFNLTSNTNFRISARGSDGTTRVANITLA